MSKYLKKLALFPPLIDVAPSNDLDIIVVIPCYDEPDLLHSLDSLFQCTPPTCKVEVIVVINDSEIENKAVKDRNQQTFLAAQNWSQQHISKWISFHFLYKNNLPKKIAGVGTARKIGMDEAVRRFEAIENPKGIICCYDADSLCEVNYFQAVENYFQKNPKAQASGIYYEHPLEGDDFSPEIYDAIIDYELHLRYYGHAQRWADFPYAFQTIGSSMAVRSDAYQQQGGMNKRKAGEDFYFIHKFIPLGNFADITDTKVIPSPRQSHRVPFGTGRAVNEILEKQTTYMTYHPQIFDDLRPWSLVIPSLFSIKKNKVEDLIKTMPKSVQSFLLENDFQSKLTEIQSNTTNLKTFKQRYYRWFSAFMMMKYVHFSRDHFYPNIPIEEAARWLLEKKTGKDFSKKNKKEMLEEFRRWDQQPISSDMGI